MQPSRKKILISIQSQKLTLLDKGTPVREYDISSAANGTGFEEGSLKTPTGRFRIVGKIGAGEPEGTVFRSRQPTGEIHPPATGHDLVMTRILWLDGLDTENANTKSRYIYIHGTNHEETIGFPQSHGCIRMRNADIIDLCNRIPEGTEVEISA